MNAPRLGAALAAIAITVAAAPARAGTCCASVTSAGVGKLLEWESAAAGAQLVFASGTGAWAADGAYEAFRGYSDRQLRMPMFALLRATPRLLVQLRTAAVSTWRASSLRSEHGFGLGDSDLGVRHEFVTLEERSSPRFPLLSATALVVLPTGQAEEGAGGTLGARVTGRGDWRMGLVATAEWASGIWFGRVDLGASMALPRTTSGGDSVQAGPLFSALAQAGAEVTPEWVVSGGVRGSWETDGWRNALDDPDTGGRITGANLQVAWHPGLSWRWFVSADSDLGFSGAGVNRPTVRSVMAGCRWAWVSDE